MKKPIAIYRTGSSCLLKNYNDIDLVYYYATEEDARKALIKYRHTEKENIHFRCIEKEKRVFLGCYIFPFMEKISGEDVDLSFSIFEHKEEYIELLRKCLAREEKLGKQWYHILCACYMLKNGSYELTEAQLKAVQKAHDNCSITAKQKELVLNVLK